jgi:hypothetical protein
MKNFIQNGSRITFPASIVVTPNNYANPFSGGVAADGPKSGEQGVVGRIVGVVVSDSINSTAGPLNDSNVVLETKGVFQLTVTVVHRVLTVGETCYINPLTGVLSDDYTQVPYGCVCDQVNPPSGLVRVLLFGATPGAIGADS